MVLVHSSMCWAFLLLLSKIMHKTTTHKTTTHARARARTHTRTHARTHSHTHKHKHTHTHTHTHTQRKEGRRKNKQTNKRNKTITTGTKNCFISDEMSVQLTHTIRRWLQCLSFKPKLIKAKLLSVCLSGSRAFSFSLVCFLCAFLSL